MDAADSYAEGALQSPQKVINISDRAHARRGYASRGAPRPSQPYSDAIRHTHSWQDRP